VPSTPLFSVRTSRWSLVVKTAAKAPGSDLERLQGVLRRSGDPTANPIAIWTCSDPEAVWEIHGAEGIGAKGRSVSAAPRIFENRQYLLVLEARPGACLRHAGHPLLSEIEEGLDLDERSCHGTLRTGNDIGRFVLEIETEQNGTRRTDRVTWQVWPLKLDYGRDLAALTREVEKEYPLWLFRFLAPTDHEAGKADRPGDRFLLLWLKQFEALRKRFEDGVRIVLRSPHQRLETWERHLRADRIRGRLAPRLEEAIARDRNLHSKRHRVQSVRSSLDTLENRFVKEALGEVAARLERIEGLVKGDKVSQAFRLGLSSWTRKIRSYAASPMFRIVGDFEGLTQESLVLHHRAGYSSVYRSWIELRQYLEFFAKLPSANIGMREISDLYEIWCFLALRRVLVDLGFEEVAKAREPALSRSELKTELENGLGAAFVLRHAGAGIQVRLAHEPIFGRNGTEEIHSFTVSQKPDIVLEATWTDAGEPRKLLWVFDAKYRVKTVTDTRDEERPEDSTLVPPDAIDQMHRYRDSLILRQGSCDKSRPVIGAYALYPGFFDQTRNENPYDSAIAEVGVGAFPIVPASGHDLWLKRHLKFALGLTDGNQGPEDPATLLAQENVRIPVTGLEYKHEDVLVVFLKGDRDRAYLDRFRTGGASLYHTRIEGGPASRRLGAVRWLAAVDPVTRKIPGAYRVLGIRGVPRNELTRAETGVEAPPIGGPAGVSDYHALDLGEFVPRTAPLDVPTGVGGNWFRYAAKERFDSNGDFRMLSLVREQKSHSEG